MCIMLVINDSGSREDYIASVIDELMLMITDGTILTGENAATAWGMARLPGQWMAPVFVTVSVLFQRGDRASWAELSSL